MPDLVTQECIPAVDERGFVYDGGDSGSESLSESEEDPWSKSSHASWSYALKLWKEWVDGAIGHIAVPY